MVKAGKAVLLVKNTRALPESGVSVATTAQILWIFFCRERRPLSNAR